MALRHPSISGRKQHCHSKWCPTVGLFFAPLPMTHCLLRHPLCQSCLIQEVACLWVSSINHYCKSPVRATIDFTVLVSGAPWSCGWDSFFLDKKHTHVSHLDSAFSFSFPLTCPAFLMEGETQTQRAWQFRVQSECNRILK